LDAVSSILTTSAQLAAIYGLVVLAVVLSFRIANFADLTMDGSFTLGGAVGAIALLRGNAPPIALGLGMAVGSLAGICTALLHTRIGVNRLLAGIITMTILYSVNLRVMGRPNVSLLDQGSVFNLLPVGKLQMLGTVLFAVVVTSLIWVFLRTDLGHFMRAAGENPRVVVRRGFPEEIFLVMALFLANGLAALAGGLAAQNQGFTDVGMGTGLVIASLTGLLLGEAILPPRSVPKLLAAALVGALGYQVLVAVGLRMGINPWDLKLATGLLLIGVLILKRRLRTGRSAENIGCDPL
jgi:putative ABC transport system permease protein